MQPGRDRRSTMRHPSRSAIVLDNAPTSAWKTVDDDRLARMKEIATWMITRVPPTSRIAIIDRSATPVAFSLDLASAVSKVDQLAVAGSDVADVGQDRCGDSFAANERLGESASTVITRSRPIDVAIGFVGSRLGGFAGRDAADSIVRFRSGRVQGTNRTLSVPSLVDATPPRDSPVTVTTTLELPTANDNDSCVRDRRTRTVRG